MIDGANSWRIFCDVTLPSILPVLAVGIVLKPIFSLKMFDQVYMLTNGGPGNARRPWLITFILTASNTTTWVTLQLSLIFW
ncbi:MAG: hypothetical protein CM1200mP30_14630 [Pseudomonadota bacterium]|nr:MAG: hypothetical protein CM1200mP30_14630 [Pseudomonadota bacterium]